MTLIRRRIFVPLFAVTNGENGCADVVVPDADEHERDKDRLLHYGAALHQVQRAVVQKHPVVGYFPWSLLDNFECAVSYAKRFGLVRVHFSTQKRSPKLSYHRYQEVIR